MRNEELFIRDVGRVAGVELTLDKEGSCSLVVDGRVLTVKYRPDADDWLMFGIVVDAETSPLPPETLSLVLEASLFGAKTRGFVPGRCGNAILLSGRVDAAAAQPEGFSEALVLLADAVGELSSLVQGIDPEQRRNVPKAEDATAPLSEDFLRI